MYVCRKFNDFKILFDNNVATGYLPILYKFIYQRELFPYIIFKHIVPSIPIMFSSIFILLKKSSAPYSVSPVLIYAVKKVLFTELINSYSIHKI